MGVRYAPFSTMHAISTLAKQGAYRCVGVSVCRSVGVARVAGASVVGRLRGVLPDLGRQRTVADEGEQLVVGIEGGRWRGGKVASEPVPAHAEDEPVR